MRRFLSLLAILSLCASISAQAQVPMTGAGLGVPSVAAGCSQATAFLARTSGLDAAHQNAYTTLICGLVSAGVWSHLDAFYVFATADRTTATLNLVSTSFTASPQPNNTTSPTWAVDTGYTGVDASTTVYIDSTFNPGTGSPQFTINSAHVSVWNNSNITSSNAAIGLDNSVLTYTLRLYPKFTTDSKSYFRVNENTGTVSGGVTGQTDARGFYLANRSASSGTTSEQGYFDGVDQGMTAVSSTAVSSANIYTLGHNNGAAAAGAANQLMATSIGGSLTPTQVASFYTLLHAYLVTIAGIAY